MSLEPAHPSAPVSSGDSRWQWLSVIPLGLGAWAPIYAGARTGKRSWWLLGLVWTLVALAGWAVSLANNGNSDLGGFLIIIGWVGAIATSFAIRPRYARLQSSGFRAALMSASERLEQRELARRLAREHPALAREAGIGRPDLPDAQHAGLVDLNNAPLHVVSQVPDVDEALARRIVELRAQTGGFSSVEDLGAALDLDAHLVEALRERVVFLPR